MHAIPIQRTNNNSEVKDVGVSAMPPHTAVAPEGIVQK